MPPTSVRELDDDSVALLLQACVDQMVANRRRLCAAPLAGLCAALYGPGRCGGADADGRLWKYACEKMGLAVLPVYPGGPPTWRATFQSLCDELRWLGGGWCDERLVSHAFYTWTEIAADERVRLFLYAAGSGYALAVVHWLVAGADVNGRMKNGRTALIEASEEGRVEVVRLLLAAGAGVDAQDDEDEVTALIEASRWGHPAVVEVLLGAGADVEAHTRNGPTALMAASEEGRVEIVRRLLAAGADVDARDANHETALFTASRAGEPDVVEVLLAAGAAVDARDRHGTTPLIEASWGHNYAIRTDAVRALLAAGADVNARDQWGRTALSMASGSPTNRTDIVRALLAAGADVNARDQWGQTALDRAGAQPIVEVLRAAGGRRRGVRAASTTE